jgi:NACalpha-BTF3-like transcription factor
MLLAVMASCSKLGEMKPEYFTVNPNPLEVKAGKVEGTITANFPEKYFKKNATVVVTPVLRYEGGEATSAPSTYQGEKVEGNNETIQYKAGGTVTQSFSFDYVPEMAQSVLTLRFKATVGKKNKVVEIPDVDIAVGCLATSTLADASTVKPAYAKDNFVRDTKEVTEADIMFAIQQSNVKTNDDVKALQKAEKEAAKDEKRTVDGISVVSAASPDGGAELNEKLAAARQKNTLSFLKQQKSQAAVDAQYIAQDWEGFKKLVQESSVKDKDLILRVLGSYSDPETREKEIKNLSAAYKELASDILPKLRRSHMALNVTLKGKTDEEILALAESNPDSLNVEELMFAAKLACQSGNKDAAAKYTEANAKQNASDWRTQNNLAALDNSDNNGGKGKAEVSFNRGLLSLTDGDTEAAKQYFGQAAGVENLNEGQGVLYIQEGDYAKAISSFGNTTSNNAALAQLLVNENDKAKSILDNVEKKDATTYYMLAICAARGANDADVIANLKKAAELDADYAKRAKTDIEFAKYWPVAEFQAIAK